MVNKLTKQQLYELFRKFNKEHNGTTESITGVIVFKSSNWREPYSLESRSYRVSSLNKAFLNCGGYSIFASNLDDTDSCVRLDRYTHWEVDYCYLED